MIKNICVNQHDGCFDSSLPNAPWCYEHGKTCKGDSTTISGYECQIDPICSSWNTLQWGSDCQNVDGLLYKTKDGIFKCEDGASSSLYDINHINNRCASYGTDKDGTDGNFTYYDRVNISGGMLINNFEYIYALIDHTVFRYNTMTNINYTTWEELPNNGSYKMSYIVLDNAKNNIYGIPYGTNQNKIFKYDLLKKIWSQYTPVPSIGDGLLFMKILFTVDGKSIITLDSAGNIYNRQTKILDNTVNNPIQLNISDMILNNMGTHIIAYTTEPGTNKAYIYKLLLTSKITTQLTGDKNITSRSYDISSVNSDSNIIMTASQATTAHSTNYNAWSCSNDELVDNNNTKLQNCGPSDSWGNMGLGSVYGLDAAQDKCDKTTECAGFYQNGQQYYFTTITGIPPVPNRTVHEPSCECAMSNVFIKKNISGITPNSLLLSYDGTKVYFITLKGELK
jgi:hypothetical protein